MIVLSINTYLNYQDLVERIEFDTMCVYKYKLIEKYWSKAFITKVVAVVRPMNLV